MRMGRSHPVLFSFAMGATLGFLIAVVLMSTVGTLKVLMNPLLLMLWPASIVGLTDIGGPHGFTRFLILMDLVTNTVLYGFVFAIPVGLVITIRRSFGTAEKPTSIGPALRK